MRTAIALLALIAFSTLPAHALVLEPDAKNADLIEAVVKITKRRHFVQLEINDRLGSDVFEAYIDGLDPTKSHFTQADLVSLERWRRLMDDQLEAGQQSAAFDIYNRYIERARQRLNHYLDGLTDVDLIDFDGDERLELDPELRDFAADDAELRALWRLQAKNQMLNLLSAGQGLSEASATLQRRFNAQLNRLERTRSMDVVTAYLNAYTLLFDPHTTFYGPRESENFDINMSLQLEGIGAVLQAEDELTKVVNLIPGGPAEKGGELKAADNIVGVGQAGEEVVDVIGWRLDEVVQLIRGPKGSAVRLEVIPGGAPVGSPSRFIDITRDRVQLEDQSAQSQVLELELNGVKSKVGVIDVPTFYTDFAARQAGDPDYRSTTKDVAKILEDLQSQGVDSLIIDLRGNGGGALQEANSLTGLFIRSGPVVQIRGTGRRQSVLADQDPRVQYAGPLVVLVDRSSASASEIFAGAIQDYGRGLIVGNQTFGKGTVQAVIPVGDAQVKLTQAKFYRISGDSTQNRGVKADLLLPMVFDPADMGEGSLQRAMPYDEISPAPYRRIDNLRGLIPSLQSRHNQRSELDPDFIWWRKHVAEQTAQLADTEIRLNLNSRKALIEARRVALVELENERRAARGLDAVDEVTRSDAQDVILEAGLREAGYILMDMIELSQGKVAGTL
ncbi:carboxy terminal-processing peptidase [Litorivicinus lipolyticus]|uniref:carboxy terminal-processing peptidase n=1 Tax=Litorivicinus lipolyticus TaxID=418701 RepID=UPI003B5C7090